MGFSDEKLIRNKVTLSNLCVGLLQYSFVAMIPHANLKNVVRYFEGGK